MLNDNESIMHHDGGGYMDTTANSTMSGDGKSSFKRGQNCVPVMIAHLNRYKEDLEVWGQPAKIVTFVAIVCKIEAVSTKVNFEFRDETGTISGLKWLDADNTSYESPVSVNSYARVYGMMRSQKEEVYVFIVNIQPLEHLNELLTHLMEVTIMSLEGEKMMNEVAQCDSAFMHKSVNASVSNTINLHNATGLNKDQALVLNIIEHGDPEYGQERRIIKSQVPSYLVSKVDEILEFLSGEGHVYTTKTDNHFKII